MFYYFNFFITLNISRWNYSCKISFRTKQTGVRQTKEAEIFGAIKDLKLDLTNALRVYTPASAIFNKKLTHSLIINREKDHVSLSLLLKSLAPNLDIHVIELFIHKYMN